MCKKLIINNKVFSLQKFGIVDNEIVLQVIQKETKEKHFILVKEFSITNVKPTHKKLIKKISDYFNSIFY
jgi:hypothetical protein